MSARRAFGVRGTRQYPITRKCQESLFDTDVQLPLTWQSRCQIAPIDGCATDNVSEQLHDAEEMLTNIVAQISNFNVCHNHRLCILCLSLKVQLEQLPDNTCMQRERT